MLLITDIIYTMSSIGAEENRLFSTPITPINESDRFIFTGEYVTSQPEISGNHFHYFTLLISNDDTLQN
ncbi:hypothetical protein QPK13_06605 [Photorhabdus tasmaniensis]